MEADRPPPIDDEEYLYRRVPAQWYDGSKGLLSDQAFAPHKDQDKSGISLYRARFKSVEDAARGRGKNYMVAVVRVGDIRDCGMSIESRPDGPDDIAHVEIPELTALNRKESRTQVLQRTLVGLVSEVRGPYSAPSV